ncbi:hypothetical protein DT019_03050 [Streptomyces sp. SDr-06]|uniref:hypothetical protein n=1 Tax=Streptomyces sp. SDr-06 TaxID=2267702 RepID=UPI000DEB8507|nr:hypothetical protein [Streptomyces sp. SDr-06]RCH70481.1 hypothetical protein DT019_03050 [Streptomyces sp. SDr-06]
MTVSPPLNGHQRPAMPVLGDWRAVTTDPKPADEPDTAPLPDVVAQAQAEAIRAQAWADAEAIRIAAEAAAQAEIVRAEEEARKLRLANDRAERKAREEEAASDARIADHNRRREDADRARQDAARQAAEQEAADAKDAMESEAAESQWRGYARGFYIVCAIVALPVQIAAFYNPHAVWLMAAPLMLEGAAWVVQKGAAAASAARRACWHYRLIAWLFAFIAAGINLWHGLNAFDPATAIGTAFASIAGPGVWDLHEHGRIRKRDGIPTRKQRREQRKTERAEAVRKAAEEARSQAEKEAADKAAAEAIEQLAESRARQFPKVWEHALKLAAAVGETTVTETVWRRAHRDIEGTDPGESAEVIRARNAAETRVEAARQNTTVNTAAKVKNTQRAAQMPPTPRTGPKVRGVRSRGDTPRYVKAARKQASITARHAAADSRQKDQ